VVAGRRLAAAAAGLLFHTPAEAIPFSSPPGSSSFLAVRGCLNQKYAFKTLVDTGAVVPFGVLLSPAAARQAGLRWSSKPTKISRGAIGASVPIHRAHIQGFSIGPVSIGDDAGVSPAVAAAGRGGQFDAVVGSRFLWRSVFTIDYRRRDVEFGGSPPSGGIPFLLAPKEPLIVIGTTVNGRAMRFAFDTAAASTLVSNAAARTAGLAIGRPVQIRGGGGTETALRSRATIDVRGLGAPRAIPVIISSAVDRAGAEAGLRIDGVIGPAALGLASLSINYPRRRLWLNPALAPHPFARAVRCGRL
jgi:predicted aspartyl protease